MSQPSAPASKPSKRKSNKTLMVVSLIAVSAITLAAGFMMISESQVKADYDNTFQAIGAAIGKKKVSRQDVKKYLQGHPDRKFNEERRTESFNWNGTMGTYGFQLEYDLYWNIERIKPK